MSPIIATSDPVSIIVVSPSIAITAPANGTVSAAPFVGVLEAVVSDPPPGAMTVTFYNGLIRLGTVNAAPFQLPVTLLAGVYTLTAVLTDATGVTYTSAPVTLTVESVTPQIRITLPTAGQRFTAPATFTLEAEVTNPPTGFLTIEFLDGATVVLVTPSITATTTYRQSGIYANVGVGTHVLTARLVGVDTPPPTPTAPTANLQASPSSIVAGNLSQLTWSSTDADAAQLTPGIGAVATAGSQNVGPTSSQAYTLTVSGPGGSAQAQATVLVTQPPPPVPTTQISTADLGYLGFFKVPSMLPFPNTDFSFSQALLTGRRVAGVSTVILSGPEFQAGIGGAAGLVELLPPAENTLTSNINTAPSATFVRRWGQGVFTSNTLLPNSGPPDNNTPRLTGIHYAGNDFGNATQLFWTYGSAYGDPGYFPNVSTSVLADNGTWASYGPWGSQDIGWEGLCGWFCPVPATVQAATGCGPLGIGATVRGNAGSSPWGVNLQAFSPVVVGTPADTLLTHTLTTRTAIYHDMAHPQARNTNYRFCQNILANDCSGGFVISASNDGFPANPGGTPGPFPVFGLSQQNYPGMGITLDWIDCMCWIHGPSKSGVLAFGQLAETIAIANGFTQNLVYTGSDPTHCHVGYGGNPDCTGQNDPTFSATGPFAGSLVHYGWIYSEADFIAILNGTTQPYGASPVQTFHMHTIAAGIPEQRLQKYAFGGAWFDAATNRLYLAEAGRYLEGFDLLPIVHVFTVNC